MMYRIGRICLCLLLVVCLCLPAFAGEDLSALAEELTVAMEQGDFAPVMARLDPAIAPQLSADALSAAMAQVTQMAGEYQGVIGVTRNDSPQGIIVDVYARHSGRALRVRLVFNDQTRITGLWMQPVTPEEIAALFPEQGTPETADPRGVELSVQVGEYQLPGILTLPAGEGLPIAVLLVAGSGPNDRDSTIGKAGNKPLRDLALGLASRGIASLRYDKRTLARPDVMAEKPTIRGEVLDDVQSAVQLLLSHEQTQGHTLYLAGHSLGGMLAPAILAENPALAGAIILAGTPRSLWDVIYDQNAAIIPTLPGYTAEQKTAMLTQVEEQRDAANAVTADGEGAVFGMPLGYIASLNNLNLTKKAAANTKPLLILQGEKDVQVSATVDFEAWKTVLAGQEQVTYKLYPTLNHLFMESVDGTLNDYDIAGQVAPEVITDIADWLIAQAE